MYYSYVTIRIYLEYEGNRVHFIKKALYFMENIAEIDVLDISSLVQRVTIRKIYTYTLFYETSLSILIVNL